MVRLTRRAGIRDRERPADRRQDSGRDRHARSPKQGLLVNLGDDALVVRLLSVRVEPPVKVRGGGEGGRPQPHQEHDRGREAADRTPMSGCRPELHAV